MSEKEKAINIYNSALKKRNEGKYEEALADVEGFDLWDLNVGHHLYLFQLKIFLLRDNNRHKEAFEAAEEAYGGSPHTLDNLLLKTAVILGHGYKLYKGDYEASQWWYNEAACLAKKENLLELSQKYYAIAKQTFDLLQDNKEDDMMNQDKKDDMVNQDKQSDISEPSSTPSTTIWKFSFIPIQDVDDVDDRIRFGEMEIGDSLVPAALVSPSKEQLLKVEKLVTHNYSQVLRVHAIAKDSDEKKLLLCESVVTLDSFFKAKLDDFKKKKGGTVRDEHKKDWYPEIAQDLTRITRDVVLGLLELFLAGYSCGKLRDNIFVTKNSSARGRILPSLGSSKEQANDIVDLRKKIESIIRMPFHDNNKSVHFANYGLPIELQHLLSSLHAKMMAHVPLVWLAWQPYIWDRDDRFEFVQRLRFALKRQEIDAEKLDSTLQNRGKYGIRGAITWQHRINNHEFKTVYDDKEFTYVKPLDIQKYINASHAHINDPPKQNYSDAQIDEHIRSFFPEVYAELHECLMLSAEELVKSGKANDNLLSLSKRFQVS